MYNFNYITPERAAELGVTSNIKDVKYYSKLSKKEGICDNCENPRWKLVNNGLCFSCTTGEIDASGDYELIQKEVSMYAVEVLFQNQNDNKLWTYKVDDSIKLRAGDKVVVPVLKDDIFKVATVVKVVKEPKLKSNIGYRWVVQKLDLAIYNKCLASSDNPNIGARL